MHLWKEQTVQSSNRKDNTMSKNYRPLPLRNKRFIVFAKDPKNVSTEENEIYEIYEDEYFTFKDFEEFFRRTSKHGKKEAFFTMEAI